jgi:hypothetical protein
MFEKKTISTMELKTSQVDNSGHWILQESHRIRQEPAELIGKI